jgi:Aminotransferase class-III
MRPALPRTPASEESALGHPGLANASHGAGGSNGEYCGTPGNVKDSATPALPGYAGAHSGGSRVTAMVPDRWLNELSRTSRDLRLVRGEGAYVWDDEERQYLDLTSSGGTTLLGHNHPRVGEAITNQLMAFSGAPPGFDYDLREELLEALSFMIPVPLTHVSFTTSGSAAVDLAITLVASASDRPRLIAMQRSDHGSGIGGRGVSSGRRLGEIAGRNLEVVRVPFDDLDALSAQLDERVAAVLVEPVQVEAGVRVPAEGYLASVAERCRSVGALLVVDEVRTALRMGPILASAARGVGPDIVCLGSSLAGGMPFGVTAVGPSIAGRPRVARRDHEEACPGAGRALVGTAAGPPACAPSWGDPRGSWVGCACGGRDKPERPHAAAPSRTARDPRIACGDRQCPNPCPTHPRAARSRRCRRGACRDHPGEPSATAPCNQRTGLRRGRGRASWATAAPAASRALNHPRGDRGHCRQLRRSTIIAIP